MGDKRGEYEREMQFVHIKEKPYREKKKEKERKEKLKEKERKKGRKREKRAGSQRGEETAAKREEKVDRPPPWVAGATFGRRRHHKCRFSTVSLPI